MDIGGRFLRTVRLGIPGFLGCATASKYETFLDLFCARYKVSVMTGVTSRLQNQDHQHSSWKTVPVTRCQLLCLDHFWERRVSLLKVSFFYLLGLTRSDRVDIGFNEKWSKPITPERIKERGLSVPRCGSVLCVDGT